MKKEAVALRQLSNPYSMAQQNPQNQHQRLPEEEGFQEPFEFHPDDIPPALSSTAKQLIIFASIIVILLSAMFIIRDNVLVIRKLTVHGITNVPWQTVALSAGLNASSNYFNLDEETIKEGINRNRYLVYLGMDKGFPNKLTISVKERLPIANIRYIGINYVMADDGMILEKVRDNQLVEDLTTISGLSIQDIQVGSLPALRRNDQMPACVELLQELILQGMMANVQDINFSEPGTIYMTTRNGYTVHLGNRQYLRAKVGTVRGVIQELQKQGYQGGVIEATVPGEANYRPDHT